MLFIRYIVFAFCVLLFTSTLKADECLKKNQNVSDLKEISCAVTDLWMAMANERLSKVIANTEFFVEYDEKNNPINPEISGGNLEAALEKAHEDHQEKNSAKKDYTFNVMTYPAEEKEDTCKENSTIQKRELSEGQSKVDDQKSSTFVSYSPIEGTEPRYFQLRKKAAGELVVCEKSALSHAKRSATFCGDNKKCIESLPASCDQLDQGKGNVASACVSIDDTKPVIHDFLGVSLKMIISGRGPNVSLEYKFCPKDCSFYTQTLQKVRKVTDTEYCTENYLIIHCGSKAAGGLSRKFNLNIREVDDFCEDFNVVCYREGQAEEESEVDLSEEEATDTDELFEEESPTESDEESSDLSPVDEVPDESPAEDEISPEEETSESPAEDEISPEEETSAQPIDETLNEGTPDNWLQQLLEKIFRGKKQERNNP